MKLDILMTMTTKKQDSNKTAESIVNTLLQGPPLGIDIMYLVLADRNIQVRFGLKVVWES